MKKINSYGLGLVAIATLGLGFNGCQSVDMIKIQRTNYVKQQQEKELNAKLKKVHLNKVMFATDKINVYDNFDMKKVVSILNKYDKVVILDINEKTGMLKTNKGYIKNRNLTKEQIMCDLVVNTNVENPTIKIVNIDKPYKPHMKLKKGKYTLKVTKIGYYDKKIVINLTNDVNKNIILEKKVFNPNKDISKMFFTDTSKFLSQPEFYYGQGDAIYEVFIDPIKLVGSAFKMPKIQKRFKKIVIKKVEEFTSKDKTIFEKKYTKHIHIENIPLMTENNYNSGYWSLCNIDVNDGISTDKRYTNPEGYPRYDRKISEKILGLDKFDFEYKYEEDNAPIIITQNSVQKKLRFILPTNKAIEMYNKTKGEWDLWVTAVPHVELEGNGRLGDDSIAIIFNISWDISQIVEKNSGFVFKYHSGIKSDDGGFKLKN